MINSLSVNVLTCGSMVREVKFPMKALVGQKLVVVTYVYSLKSVV